MITIQPQKAYGTRGQPPNIPANATLVYEIELLDWTDSNDIDNVRDCKCSQAELNQSVVSRMELL